MDLATQILGLTLIVIGFVGLFAVVGMMIYPMRGGINPSGMLIVLFALIALGVSILVLLSNVPADQLTPAHETLLTIGDGMIKLSIGAILGLGGSRLAAARGNGALRESAGAQV